MKKVISEASSKYLALRRVSMSSQRRFGTAYHLLNASGKLFLKAESGVRLGGTVLNSCGRKVGIVFDLFIPIIQLLFRNKASSLVRERYVGGPFFLGVIRH